MLKPNKKYIIVEPIKQETKTESGIILPDTKEKTNSGKVITIGGNEPEYGVGDTVIYKEWSAVEYNSKDKKYLIIKKEDIIAYEK